ncbi:MAG: hypothetical protein Q9166_002310 [cf. Caloplaca sp. 2 TL-2023]
MTDGPPGDNLRTALSPRPKGRGCAFNHDVVKATPTAAQAESVKKRFNVDSPSFTPASLAINGNQAKSKVTGISPKFANAAPFKPKGAATSTAPSSTSLAKGYNPNAPEWTAPDAQEFLPSSFNSIPPSVSLQMPGHAKRLSSGGRRIATPSPIGDRRKQAHSDEQSLYKRPAAPSGHSSQSPAEMNRSNVAAPGNRQDLQPSSSGNQLPSKKQLDPLAAFSMPHYLNYSSLAHPTKNELLNFTGQGSFQANHNGDSSGIFDHCNSTPSIPPQSQPTPQTQINPYSQDGGTMGSGSYYPSSTNYPQQLQHHLYAALPPHRELSQPNQRTARDFFIPEDLRQTLVRKSEASRMTIPNSTLPPNIAHYHTLVPLVHNSQKSDGLFGYKSHAYRATSGNDGQIYCLRRLQGYRVNEAASEHAIRNIQQNWKRVRSSSVVSVHLAFTNSSFGDSSLIFVTDFHPLAETLAQRHFASSYRYTNRYSPSHVPEQILWGYIVQITSALKIIHSAGLAARVIDASKILLTGEGRIRLNACGILDVIQADADQILTNVQRMDLVIFGKLILALGSNNASQHNQGKAFESFSRSYSPRLRELTNWLLDCISPKCKDNIEDFAMKINSEMLSIIDSFGHSDDALYSALARELENARITRLMFKINSVIERPENEHDRQWAEHGSRSCIRLFRDYVFHQVNPHGSPVLNLAHMLECLNKLDAGIEEKIMLTTRDEETVIVVSYKEIKTAIDGAYHDLEMRATRT